MFWCVACEELDLETYLSFPLISKAPSLRMAIALGIISAMMHNDFEEVYNAALATQSAWASGNVSRFEIVEQFFLDSGWELAHQTIQHRGVVHQVGLQFLIAND